MKAKLLVGVSASGKSTYAAELCKQGYVALDRDDLRFSFSKLKGWDQYKFDDDIENIITKSLEKAASIAHIRGRHVVIAETSLEPSSRGRWKNYLRQIGFKVEEVPMRISLDEAIDRDSKRDYPVGIDVIRAQWKDWQVYLKALEGGK